MNSDAAGSGPSGEFPEPLTIHWANWSKVTGAYASGFAFAAVSLHRPELQPARMSEPDLLESVTQLGRVERHKEVNLVRLMTQLEARGVPSPGGLARVDWLRSVDPTLTASAARAVVTCAAAFNEPRREFASRSRTPCRRSDEHHGADPAELTSPDLTSPDPTLLSSTGVADRRE